MVLLSKRSFSGGCCSGPDDVGGMRRWRWKRSAAKAPAEITIGLTAPMTGDYASMAQSSRMLRNLQSRK